MSDTMLADKEDCCGCNACGDICPKSAISFQTDEEGFWYPLVAQDKCINCHVCEKICPILNKNASSSDNALEPECYAARHRNLAVRFDSTSGGVFSALADVVYRQGGFVGGAVYNEDFSARQFLSNCKDDLARLRSSKYVQSNAEGFYKVVREALNSEKTVLVCGTPCQIAGLKNFLDKGYANLVTVDFICHSIASPKAHRKYLDYLEEEFDSKVVQFKAKNKELGWRSLTKKSTFQNGKANYGVKGEDCYSRAYHSDMIDRPSCYVCKFKGYPRVADISLGDCWGVERFCKQLDDDMGTSAVMLNSAKGKAFFEVAKKYLETIKIGVNDLDPGNPALRSAALRPHYDRTQFFKDMDVLRFDVLADKYFPVRKTPLASLRNIKHILGTVKSVTQLKPKPLAQFLYYNFLHPAVHTDWKRNALLYPSPNCIIDIHRNASVTVNGEVLLGLKRIRKSRLESRFLVEKKADVVFAGNFRFGYGCDVEVFEGAKLSCGTDSGGNIGLTLICGNNISIGKHTFYGRNVSIRDTNGGHYIAMQGYKNTNPVRIGDFCWLCSESKVMAGVKIGDGTVVGSNSVVMTPLPSHVLVSGFPAKVMETDIYWKH